MISLLVDDALRRRLVTLRPAALVVLVGLMPALVNEPVFARIGLWMLALAVVGFAAMVALINVYVVRGHTGRLFEALVFAPFAVHNLIEGNHWTALVLGVTAVACTRNACAAERERYDSTQEPRHG